VVWSVVGAAQYELKGRNSFLLCRALLGMLQGGFIPEASDITLAHGFKLTLKLDNSLSLLLLQAP